MKNLFVFDMDGTLLPGTTANLELAKVTDKVYELEELERKFSEGLINSKEFAQYIFQTWGILDSLIIEKAFLEAPKLQNIEKVLKCIAANNDISCLITMSPNFFANRFFNYGFNYIYSSTFPSIIGEKLNLEKILVPEDKPLIVKALCENLGIVMDNVYAFGDSMSDYPLFASIKNSIAINGHTEIQQKAKYHYNGNDLFQAYTRFN